MLHGSDGLPPVTPPSPLEPKQPLPGEEEKKHIEKVTDEAAKEALKEQAPPPAEPRGWFSWWWGTAEEKSAEKGKAKEEELSEGAKEGEEEAELTPEPEILLRREEREDRIGEGKEGDFFEEDFILMNEEPEIGVAPAKREQLKESASKAEEVGKAWWWQRVGTGIANYGLGFATARIQNYANSYAGKIDKQNLIKNAKESMVKDLQDPQMAQLCDFINDLALKGVDSKLDELKKLNEKTPSFTTDNVLLQRQLLKDLTEINIAKGLANLARQVNEAEKVHPDPAFASQPSLVKILSLVSEKASEHISGRRLAELEEKYRHERTKFQGLTKEIYPDLENQPENQQLLNEYIQTDDIRKKNQIEGLLFPSEDELEGEGKQIIIEYKTHLRIMSQRHHEFQELFKLVANDVLVFMFPNKVNDLEVPELLKTSLIPGYLYDLVHSMVADSLQQIYEPMETDLAKVQNWEERLKNATGVHDLTPVVQAPAALLVGMTKNYIQSDPSVVDLTVAGLNEINPPPEKKEGEAEKPEDVKLMEQLSQEQFANWIVESVQTMLHTQDSNLQGLEMFIGQVFTNLTLGAMAKGAALVVPEGEKIDEKEFFKVLIDRIVAKVKSLQGEEEIPAEFWKNLLKDLSLPTPIKDLIVTYLIEKATTWKKTLQESGPALQEIQQLYDESEKRILSYKGGEQLLSITEKISDEIVEQILQKNIGLISLFGLGDTVEELSEQYLPGVKIDEDLKNWLKNNISAFGMTEEGQSPEAIVLLKQGVRAALQKALIATIEKNFKNDGDDYAAQLLKNLQQAFTKAFTGFDAAQKEKLLSALTIQSQIEEKNADITLLKAQLALKPEGVHANQLALFEEIINLNTRHLRASHYAEDLGKKLNEILGKLNAEIKGNHWTPDQLLHVSRALVIHRIQGSEKSKDYIAKLQGQVHLYRELLEGDISNKELEQELADYEMLIVLLEMEPEQLKLVSEALKADATLKHAEKEIEFLDSDLKEKKSEIEAIDQGRLENRPAWDQAKTWMETKLNGQQDINRIQQEIEDLEKTLDEKLGEFQTLSIELTALIGLDVKDNIQLPPLLQDKVWPLIEGAKINKIPRILFKQITPMLLPILEIAGNREQLKQQAGGRNFIPQLVHAVAEDAVSRIPEFVTSYKPFAKQILIIFDIEEPTPQEVVRMESTLQQTMIGLGKERTTATMLKPLVKGFVPEEKEEELSLVLENLVKQEVIEFTKEQVLELLKKEAVPVTRKEEQQQEKNAQILAKGLNHFLFNRGKSKLTPRHILDAYQGQIEGAQKAVPLEREEGILHDLQSERIVEKIKAVVFTPEEIAYTLEDVIPGATDLHSLVAPQLQAAIVGDDDSFKENRGIIQQYVEGMLLRLFVKIAEANLEPGKDILAVLTQKLKTLPPTADELKDRTAEEVARNMIDKVLKDVLGIISQEDLKGIPLPLQKMGYDKVKEQAYLQLTPLMLPIIEVAQNKGVLDLASGSKFLGNLAEALSKDLFFLLPAGVKSYNSIANEVLVLLSGNQPTAEEVDQFAHEIVDMVAQSKQKNITHKALVEAYAKGAGVDLSSEQKDDLKALLDGRHIKDEIQSILATPEEIAALIGTAMPSVGPELQKAFAEEMQGLIHANPDVYGNVTGFAQTYVQGVLLKVFMRAAQKNPSQEGKDTFVIMMEKALEAVKGKYQEAKDKPFDDAAKELDKLFLEEILGLDSPEAFDGFPDPLKETAFAAVKDQLGGFLIGFHQSLTALDNSNDEVQKARDNLKKFGAEENAVKSFGEIIAEDLAKVVVDSVPHVLAEVTGEKAMGVVVISKGVEDYLEELKKGNLQIAKVLLDYAHAPQFQKMLGDNIEEIQKEENLVEDKQKTANLLSNLILVPLNQALQKAVSFEEKHKAAFNQKLMANILHVAADHLKKLNAAKALAVAQGRTEITHEDFVQAAGANLHAAVPRAPITYQQTLDEINSRLTHKLNLDEQQELRNAIRRLVQLDRKSEKALNLKDIIDEIAKVYLQAKGEILSPEIITALEQRDLNGLTLKGLISKEAEAHKVQRQKEFYGPSTKSLLKLLFPNGKTDLTFVPEELRGQTWKLFKQNLFPVVLPMMTELILEPNVLTKIALSSLETMRDAMKPIKDLAPEEQIKLYKKGFLVSKTGKVLGDLSNDKILEMIKNGQLVEKPAPVEPLDKELDALDNVAGEVMVEALNLAKLPSWARKMMIDPKTGEISASMKKTLGATMRNKFNDTFIKERLAIALETAAKRDPVTGEFVLKYDKSLAAEKAMKATEDHAQMEADIKRVTREIVDTSISYFIRNKWNEAQARFDKLVDKAFGKIGLKLKSALDAVFRFVFFKIIGTVLSFLFSPLKGWAKEKIYDLISLDENREMLMSFLHKVPADQPEDAAHIVYHEEMIYRMKEALMQTLQEVLDQPITAPDVLPEAQPEAEL